MLIRIDYYYRHREVKDDILLVTGFRFWVDNDHEEVRVKCPVDDFELYFDLEDFKRDYIEYNP